MNLEEVNDLLNLDLPLSEGYQTLGGFLIYHMQKIPTIGEQLRYDSFEFTVTSAEGPRLTQIQIHRLEPVWETQEADVNVTEQIEPMESGPLEDG
jgi:CBS domain containing-hemolysin-like protein